KPVFFQAKKLAMQEEKLETFISDLIYQKENTEQWVNDFFNEQFHYEPDHAPHKSASAGASILDMLHANDLNPNTALLYFKWVDANLDDIEKMFPDYGH
ncbi:MAG: hypothetical protein WCF67_10055, partial [Chitinophagaceae bacterium]